MNPIAHLFSSWTLADLAGTDRKSRMLVTWAGVLPDLDGLGLLVDVGNRLLGRPETSYYSLWHHWLLHGLPGVIFLAGALSLLAVRRRVVLALGFLTIHFHLLCDLAGSRGSNPGDIWPIPYLAPISERLTLHWNGQWPLDSWPNIAFLALLLGYAFYRAAKSGYSPLEIFGTRTDSAFVAAVRRRWSSFRS